jgi:hypothetical protein
MMGCKDENEDKVYTITGKVVTSCDNPVPVANLPFELWYYSDSKRDSKQHATGVTDEKGYFSVQYTQTNGGFNSSLELILANGPFGQKPLLSKIPQNQNLNIGNIYTDTNFYLLVKIITTRSFTVNDTLFYIAGTKDYKSLVGPFANEQIIDTISVSRFDGWSYYGEKNTPYRGSNIKYKYLIGIKYSDFKRNNEGYINAELCKKYNFVHLDLDKINP